MRDAPDLHVMWGWLQVDEVIPVRSGATDSWMSYHPHMATSESRAANNTLYVARETLSARRTSSAIFPAPAPSRTYDERLRLTKPGYSRSVWALPQWFFPEPPRPPLGYHGDPERWQVRRRSA